MVATRNTSLEPIVEPHVQNWVNTKIDEQLTRFREEFTVIVQNTITAALSGSNGDVLRRNGEGTSRGTQPQFTRMTKIEFPKFGGEDVRGWLYKCEQFFEIDQVSDSHKVQLASIHLYDTASLWHRQFVKLMGENASWNSFKEAILLRFGSAYDDPMAEIKNLRQVGNIEEYQNAFDKLNSRVDLPEEQQISFYIAGLQKEIELAVRMFRPKTLAEVYNLSKIQDAALKLNKQRYRPPLLPTPRFITNQNTQSPQNSVVVKQTPAPNTTLAAKSSFNTPYPKRQLSQKEFQERRAKNLCFYCDEKYTPGHSCRGQVFNLEVVADSVDTSQDDSFLETGEDLLQEEGTGEIIEFTPQISLHALNGVESFQTMRVTGHVGKQSLHILIDTGSTHNFLDLDKAKKLGCTFSSTCPLKVDIPGGAQLISKNLCKKFAWKMHGEDFVVSAMVLPLGGCDMVLGVQWLSTLGDIMLNFQELRMEFKYKGRKVALRGTRRSGVQWMEGFRVPEQTAQLSSMVLCVYPSTTLNMVSASTTEGIPSPISTLLSYFDDVFAVPTALPPIREYDHKIVLKKGTEPIFSRPYRHPPTQKDAIEEMVKELLESGVIRPSQSPFSSPVVMVKKKDGTWRMCIDYRRLNEQTIKDKFPIPIIEELIDELQGSQYFSKLDLRSGFDEFCFQEVPRKFVLVFFDDILVYSPDLRSHVEHLELVLLLLRQHTLFAKKSKCVFGVKKGRVLGSCNHWSRVATDDTKIEAMKQWPIPTNLKKLRGFLGLTGYYRRFIRDYALISQPLTKLLKKNAFVWSNEAQSAFVQLKEAMMNAPVLKLPNFEEVFIVETDASGEGIGAVLQQSGHPIAYFSKTLAPRHHSLSTYEKELLAVIQALHKWRGYLLDRHFIIKTDHFSLKYLLEQRITTPAQMKWLPKLMGFDYEIMYKKGSENGAADALSRVNTGGQLLHMVLTSVSSALLPKIVESWSSDTSLKSLIDNLKAGKPVSKHYSWTRHSGIEATIQRIQGFCYWKKLRKQVKEFVSKCTVCQRSKPDLCAYPGLLQPLPIPTLIWSDISMDFIEGLPNSGGKTVIMVVVDRLSKYSHFMALSHPFTAIQVAQLFLDNVYKLHGLPKVIVSDRDKIFLSLFWKEFFKMLQVSLHFSTAYHPQTDGQTEVVNRCLECYLRCMTGERPKEWSKWLALAEYWYNTNYHTSINTTPFEAVYGQPPSSPIFYSSGQSKVDSVDRSLEAREAIIQMLQFHLERAQARMKAVADSHRTERSFEEGQWVWLKLQPHRQIFVTKGKYNKLLPKYYGPFQIVAKIGMVAYKLQLPLSAQIHPFFHVSQLKLFKGDPLSVQAVLPKCDPNGHLACVPIKVLDRKMIKEHNKAVVYVLIQWSHGSQDDAQHEELPLIWKRFPDFSFDS
ncbi:retrotransposon-related protein [Tanacetum coccineum]